MELLAFDDAISSNRSAASQDKVPSDSEDERREPRENTDKHGDEAMGNGAITSDTEDYESHVEFSPNPPAMAGTQERAASPDSGSIFALFIGPVFFYFYLIEMFSHTSTT